MTLYLNPDLCPTHGLVMEYDRVGYVKTFYCKECRHQAYTRTTKIIECLAKIKRQGYLSKHPNSAGMFEGL